ncbi:MAG: hypothetical protein IPF73_17420 [Betaproteobacteria bacterium]|nr:hypothetical protein [Betaproteobacteria bacterium]
MSDRLARVVEQDRNRREQLRAHQLRVGEGAFDLVSPRGGRFQERHPQLHLPGETRHVRVAEDVGAVLVEAGARDRVADLELRGTDQSTCRSASGSRTRRRLR